MYRAYLSSYYLNTDPTICTYNGSKVLTQSQYIPTCWGDGQYHHNGSLPPRTRHCYESDVWLTVHRNSVWIRKTYYMSLFIFFISLLIVAQHVSGNHVPIIRSWRLRDVIASCWYVPWLQGGCQVRLAGSASMDGFLRGYNNTQSSAPDDGHMVARNMLSNY